MRLYLYGKLRRKLSDTWIMATMVNVPIADYCGPNQVDHLCVVVEDGKHAYVPNMKWGSALPNGPTGVNMSRVPIEDVRVPKEVRLSEFLLSS